MPHHLERGMCIREGEITVKKDNALKKLFPPLMFLLSDYTERKHFLAFPRKEMSKASGEEPTCYGDSLNTFCLFLVSAG